MKRRVRAWDCTAKVRKKAGEISRSPRELYANFNRYVSARMWHVAPSYIRLVARRTPHHPIRNTMQGPFVYPRSQIGQETGSLETWGLGASRREHIDRRRADRGWGKDPVTYPGKVEGSPIEELLRREANLYLLLKRPHRGGTPQATKHPRRLVPHWVSFRWPRVA